jgi:hypothetical protein
MGVRLYAPVLGRFLSTDPVYGGNSTTYGYPVDPIGSYDLDGRYCGCAKPMGEFGARVGRSSGQSTWRTLEPGQKAPRTQGQYRGHFEDGEVYTGRSMVDIQRRIRAMQSRPYNSKIVKIEYRETRMSLQRQRMAEQRDINYWRGKGGVKNVRDEIRQPR